MSTKEKTTSTAMSPAQERVFHNNEGGVTENMFEITCLVPTLYEDACDEPGKRVIILVDGGPGRFEEGMMEDLRMQGFYLIPCAVLQLNLILLNRQIKIITISSKMFTGRIKDGKPTDRRRRQIEDDDRSETTLMVMIMTLKGCLVISFAQKMIRRLIENSKSNIQQNYR